MKFYRKWLLLVCLCCTAMIAQGQGTDSFQHLSKKDGLSQVSVFAIAQDSSEFMWFGTRDGLNKFDGYQFKVYKKNASANSLVANDIRTLYVGSQNNELWIGTTSGLSKYQPTSDNFINYLNVPSDTNSISGNVIRQIFEDSRGRLWVGTSVGLNLFDRENNNFTKYIFNDKSSDNIKSQDVKTILEDSQGQLWFGTANGLFKLLEKENNIFSFERMDKELNLQLSDVHIKSILEDEQGDFWIGTYKGGINYWNRKNKTTTVYQSDKNKPGALSHNNIRSMCLDHDGNLWAGTFDGLNLLKKKANYSRSTEKQKPERLACLTNPSARFLLIKKEACG